jgi:hypothetical protein
LCFFYYTFNYLYNNTYTLNSSIAHSFNRGIWQPSSNGTAIIESMTLRTYTGGDMRVGTTYTGSTRLQGITINVTLAGNVKVSASNNGITFFRSSNQSEGINSNFSLIATGTPIEAGTFTFTTNTTPSATFSITFLPRL